MAARTTDLQTDIGFRPERAVHGRQPLGCPVRLQFQDQMMGLIFFNTVLGHRAVWRRKDRDGTLMQLRFTSFVVINLRRDLHPQVCAHAGRTKKSRLKRRPLRKYKKAYLAPGTLPSTPLT